jgi:heme oxygenase
MGLALSGEVGELNNVLKKVWRGSLPLDEARAAITEEATDAFIYNMNIFGILGVDPKALYEIKRARNVRRFGNGR